MFDWHIVRLMSSNFYGCFRHETCCTEVVSKLLNFEQNQLRMDIAQDMLTTFNNNPDFLKKVITCDESRVYSYDIETQSTIIPTVRHRGLLNFDQKQRRIYIAQEMLTTFNNDPDFLKKVITCDEPRVYGYDIETEAQSSQWKAFCYD